jgi:small subunit ribosomal protein S7
MLFYKYKGFYRFLRHFVKFSRLRAILKKYGKVFKDRKKKKKKYLLRLVKTRSEKLVFLNIFFQNVIKKGRKKLALGIFSKLFTLLKFKYKTVYLEKYLLALEKIRPLLYYKVIYIGGKKYRIPVLLSLSKSYLIAIRWLLNNCKKNGKVTLALFNELNNALKNEGSVIKFRKDYHFASFENKTYIRFLRFLKGGF